jgi:hypothetical protein
VVGIVAQEVGDKVVSGSIDSVSSLPSDGVRNRSTAEDFTNLLGFDTSKNYLLLFLNNTELRPGGGFIGSYAVVRVTDGRPEIIVFDGTENLDNNAPADRFVKAPKEMEKYLKVGNWEFRDSNWSPDFAESTAQSLRFYREEGGVSADDIDAVFAITPTVLERLMDIIGPITVSGITFHSDDVVEKLEYEVEYGYRDKGVDVSNRKDIIEPFMKELIERVSLNALLHSKDFIALLEELVGEKHIMGYSEEDKLSTIIDSLNISGSVRNVDGDYLMWVDANLSALKTDRVLDRLLRYSIEKKDNDYLAVAQMRYIHTGDYDWRTTRYQSFSRVYVPTGSRLVGVETLNVDGRKSKVTEVDTGVDLGKTWFGFVVRALPGQTVTYQVSYLLPDKIADSVSRGEYRLTTQKQLGSVGVDMALELKFNRTIIGAYPAENSVFWGDSIYSVESDLDRDREFSVGF